LYVIEGVDGSGKATQTELLYQALLAEGKPVRKVSFPDYDSPSSSLIKMYLNGEFGTDPQSVNAFATSVFFAVDRFASFRKDWQEFYENGGIIIADRYVTSNLVHQAGKISDAAEKERYIQWLSDLEYNIFGLPKPDCVIFLDMPPAYSLKLRQQRNELKQGLTADIHEADQTYLQNAYENAISIAKHQEWHTISCVADDKIRTIEDIHAEIVRTINE
ncbi:MAG: deoxynucleoside kinase, partial [Peptococcaceae bacterium]|nr:deoxynucleoside kinase [Peptococcaceae bacterium]